MSLSCFILHFKLKLDLFTINKLNVELCDLRNNIDVRPKNPTKNDKLKLLANRHSSTSFRTDKLSFRN